jgi:cytochrome c553
MGFRQPLAFAVLIVAAVPLAMALSASPAPQQQTAAASGASAATPASASSVQAAASAKADAAAFKKLKAVKTKPGDAKAGKAKVVSCAACHGNDGNSTIAQYPKLSGESEQYIATQLMRFKSGVRKNAIMNGMAAALTPQEMQDIGAYYNQQKRSPGAADKDLVKTGSTLYREGDASRKVPACMACHGPDGAGNPAWRVPDIAGQHAKYVEEQLLAWHNGTTWGSDAHAQIMPTIAGRLTKKDISAVASYVQGLHAAPAPKSSAAQDVID